ncbi:MAG: DUF2344 domain-containing protein [Firmicutes bacterium]|nr:DUF2344 domain-containing protein [Bacillota bacterium]
MIIFQKLWAQLIKGPEVRFISHLDLLRAMEKALRRAGLPLSFTRGYNPRPRISFASALPVGMTSCGEYVEFIPKNPHQPEEFKEQLNKQLPTGLKIVAIKEVAYAAPALMALINLARYKISFRLPPEIKARVFLATWRDFYQQEEVKVCRQTKKGMRTFNLISHVHDQRVYLEGDNTALAYIDLHLGSRGNIRPGELLQAFWDFAGYEGCQPVIQRKGLFILQDDCLLSPLKIEF